MDSVGTGSGEVCPLHLPAQDQTPDSLPGSSPPHPRTTPTEALRISCPTEAGLGRVEEGWHFLAAASLAQRCSDKALTDRHQMLFQAAPGLARSFRFSTVGNREPGACRRHKSPSLRRGSRALERQGSRVRNRVGADAVPAPSIQPYSLSVFGNTGEGHFAPRKNDPAIIGQDKCITSPSP